MRVLSLTLRDFRSYSELSLQFSGRSSEIFIGKNGSGKTNIIEALSLLSVGRSCLRADMMDILKFGQDFFRIQAQVETDAGETMSLECVFQRSPRKASAYLIQDVKTPLLSFIATLPSITFLPQDLDIFSAAPSGRRSLIDGLLCQLQPSYARERVEYEHILKQRNALLRRVGNGEASEFELDFWDEQLASFGLRVRRRRSDLLAAIQDALPVELSALGEPVSTLRIETVDPARDLVADLRAQRSKDLLLQTTSVGPHRDDWTVTADGHAIGKFFSRGQQRTAFLALLFVSASLFSDARKEKPIILLDDVLSELDEHHQTSLLSRLSQYQVFLTTTHPIPHITGLRTWDVADGSVTEA